MLTHLALGPFRPYCAALYAATQQCRRGFGSFDCWGARQRFFRCSEIYRYSNWDQIVASRDIVWEARKIRGRGSRAPGNTIKVGGRGRL